MLSIVRGVLCWVFGEEFVVASDFEVESFPRNFKGGQNLLRHACQFFKQPALLKY